MLTDDEFYNLWKSDVINHLQLIYKKGYDDAKQELKREPLSDEEAHVLCQNRTLLGGTLLELLRDVEKAHGIGVEQ